MRNLVSLSFYNSVTDSTDHLAVVASQIFEITQNSEKIQT